MKTKLKRLLLVSLIGTFLTGNIFSAKMLTTEDVSHLSPKVQMQVRTIDEALKLVGDTDMAYYLLSGYQGQVPQDYVQMWINEGYFRDYIDEIQSLGYAVTPATSAPATTDTTPAPTHTHEYTSEVTQEPTCQEEGKTTYTCSCGDTYTEPIAVTNHDYSMQEIITEPTCTTPGEKLLRCSVCNDEKQEPIASLEHEKSDWTISKEPTCTDVGEEITTCTLCNETIQTREIQPLGHTKSETWETTTPSSLFNEGSKALKCITCGSIITTESIPINTTYWYLIIGTGAIIIVTTSVIIIRKKKK